MKNIVYLTISFLFLFSCSEKKTEVISSEIKKNDSLTIQIPEKISFPSADGLAITANLYHKDNSAPVIVLCHQARFNKFEYTGIAKALWDKGFNCLAIDQRSGGGIVEEINETNLEAKKQNKAVDFLDAEQDIIAAVNLERFVVYH